MEKQAKSERGTFRFRPGTLALLKLLANTNVRTLAGQLEWLIWEKAHTVGVVPMEAYHEWGKVGEPGVFDDAQFTSSLATKKVGLL